MRDDQGKISRKNILRSTILLPALGAAMAATMTAAQAGKATKAAVKYQSTPKGGQKCSGCRFFIAGKSAKANGQCQIVQGAIAPNAWCTAWAPKS